MNHKIISLLILTHGIGLGPVKIRELIFQFGTPENVIAAGWDEKNKTLFNKWKVGAWEEDLQLAEKENISLIDCDNSDYPTQLNILRDPPLLLYVKGNYRWDLPGLALIGTRNATLYGMQQAEKLAEELAHAQVCVISGLARGIDTAAHQGALKGGGKTIAVIGSGLGHIYPGENRGLAEKIAEQGALVSEVPMRTAPAKGLFPRRNRIVSALSQGICLIESPLAGGGMITMEIGSAQKKPLFALPGRVDWENYKGNHQLLKEKKATLVENSSDLLKHLNILQIKENKISRSSSLSPSEAAFLATLPAEEKTIEELVLLTQLPVMQLNVLLTRLILKKVVKEFPGKIYKKV